MPATREPQERALWHKQYIRGPPAAYAPSERIVIPADDMEYAAKAEGVELPPGLAGRDVSLAELAECALAEKRREGAPYPSGPCGKVLRRLWWRVRVGGPAKIREMLAKGWRVGEIRCTEGGVPVACPPGAEVEALAWAVQRAYMSVSCSEPPAPWCPR